MDTTTIEFRALEGVFAALLINNKGHLITDDYNFSIDHYNNCRLILSYITSLKLPPLFKEGLRKYYAEIIIKQGNEKNAGDEMNWLNWMPLGGTVVVSQSDMISVWPKGTIITTKTDLADLISAFTRYSQNTIPKQRNGH